MFKHILIPTDGSEVAAIAVQSGIEFAKFSGAKITVLHVSPTYRKMTDEGFLVAGGGVNVGHSGWEAAVAEHAIVILGAVTGAAQKAGVACESIHLFDNAPYHAIIATAEKSGCDVIVMGSHGYGGFKQLMVGSQTTRVLSHTKIPVLVIR